MGVILSFETSVLTKTARRNIPQVGIFHRRENFKTLIALTDWVLSGDVICLLGGTTWVFVSQNTAFFIVTAVEILNLTLH
jgi:hypothetical protein